MNTDRTATHTAASPYRTLDVVISNNGRMVQALNGALLGDVEGMERLGWEFAEVED